MAQESWANAITSISAVFQYGGDYVKTAADAAAGAVWFGSAVFSRQPDRRRLRETHEVAMACKVASTNDRRCRAEQLRLLRDAGVGRQAQHTPRHAHNFS